MANSRMKLKEFCDANGHAKPVYSETCSGPGHMLAFTSIVRVFKVEGEVEDVVASGQGVAMSKKAAQEKAACKALQSWADPLALVDPSVRSELAMVGDAALDFLLSLLGNTARLSTQKTDGLRQSLLTNHTLAPSHAASTLVEAAVGQAVLTKHEILIGVLMEAVRSAAPELAKALQAKTIHTRNDVCP